MLNLYINYLKDQQINKNLIAFADEIVIYCESKEKLIQIIQNIEKWCMENNIAANKIKSAIL